MDKTRTRCSGCEAPIQFQPGAGSRLCPFCGYTNLVREQRIAAPTLELKVDEIFHKIQRANHPDVEGDDRHDRLRAILSEAEGLLTNSPQNVRLAFYRACTLDDLERSTDAVYALIDLTGMDAPLALRADTHARLSEALLKADRNEEALDSIARCHELMEGHPTACFTQAKILAKTGHPADAARVLEQTLPALGQRWKITFPPQRSAMLLLLANIYIEEKRPHKAVVPLENTLLQETAAPLSVVAEASRLLGFNYLDSRKNKEEGLSLIRHGAMLDPTNRLGLLDALSQAVERAGGKVTEEIQSLSERRKEIMAEIRQVLQQFEDLPSMDLNDLVPQMQLSALDANPDKRTDLLESTAQRLGLVQFDRGTLYPLRTMEDFRRWVVAWRLRGFIRRLKREEAEEDRIVKLKAAREVKDGRRTFHRQRNRLTKSRRIRRRRRRLLWTGVSILVVLVLVALGLAWVGDRLLDRFDGTLTRVECQDARGTPPCTLIVATGEEGIRRHQDRSSDAWLTRTLSGWLDDHVQEDGTLHYSLELPWGHIHPKDYWSCQGKRIQKSRLSFRPVCQEPDEEP